MKKTGFIVAEALMELEKRAPNGEIERLVKFRTDKRGCKAKVDMWKVLSAVFLHPLLGAGTLGEHFSSIHGEELAESSLSERRSRIPWEVFRGVMKWLLKPLADEQEHPEAFYKGYRLIGLDGTGFSLRNTRSILRQCKKAVSRRLKAAFAKTTTSVLVELGMHNPVGAEIAIGQESEWSLSCKVLEQLPKRSLLLGDRLYGVPKFVKQLSPHCSRTSSAFLLRARSNIRSKVLRRLRDGSKLVAITIQASQRHKVIWSAEVREISATVQRKGQRAITLRLWTNLIDEKKHPAQELAELYAKRWEHELYFRELKHGLNDGELLAGQTVDTCCQDIAALLLATSVIAESRSDLAKCADLPGVTVVGFERARFHTQFIFYLHMADEDILTPAQRTALGIKLRKLLAPDPDKVPKKRFRSCPRAVRQPVKGWPRLTKNQNNYAEINVTVK